MKVSQRCASLTPSLTLALTAKAKALRAQGLDIMSFEAGEPDFDTPEFIKAAAIEDLKAGRTKYTGASGGPEIIEAVRVGLKRDYGLEYEASQIIVSVGGKHSLYNVFQALVDSGDEVIVPSPYWLSYPDQIKAAEGVPKIVTCGPEQAFKLTPAQLEAAIGPRTVALVLNSPSNPTGAVYSADELLALAAVLRKHPHVAIVSDDLYMKLVYKPATFANIAVLAPELLDRTIIVNGWSKAYAMTGWRLGWLAGPKGIVKAMANLQSHATSNVTTFCQRAGALALTSDQGFVEEFAARFDARRRLLIDGLNAIPGISCAFEPLGAFYAFPDVSALYGRTLGGVKVTNSMEFAAAALETAQVSVVPGVAFGEDRCVRLSYATSEKVIETGLARLKKFAESAR